VEYEDVMDWAAAIERHQPALTRILAGLLVLAGYANGSIAARLNGRIYRSVLRTLYPLESALRRLIVIAARGLVVKPARVRPKRPWPEGREVVGKGRGGGPIAFRLFDMRKPIPLKPELRGVAKKEEESKPYLFAEPEPRYANVYDGSVVMPWFKPPPPAEPAPKPERRDGSVDTSRLGRRLAAAKAALEDIQRQAIRLKRWQARREQIRKERPAFVSPLRPGRPPGLRKKPKDEIEQVLRECHDLAFEAEKHDTS
jgi:hypothetical protein